MIYRFEEGDRVRCVVTKRAGTVVLWNLARSTNSKITNKRKYLVAMDGGTREHFNARGLEPEEKAVL